MGLFDFVKDAGEKIFGKSKEKKAAEAAAVAEANRAKAVALAGQVKALGLKVDDLQIGFGEGVVRVSGNVPTQEEKEKVILVLGNTQGVAQVDDRMVVEKPEPEAVLYTVKRGDSLSKIAKAHYGDAMKYPVIFEANKPMLSDPNKIYPGQVLRVPPVS